MGTLNRSRIIPVSSDKLDEVEKWKLPEVKPAGAAVVPLRSAAAHKSGLPFTGSHRLAANAADSSMGDGTQDEGFQKGYQDGMLEAKQQLAIQQKALAQLLHALQDPVRSLGDQVAEELMLLAIEIARSIVKKEVHNQPLLMGDFIAEALARLPDDSVPVKITIHPDDLLLIREHAQSSVEQYNIEWIENDNNARGSFQLNHDASVIRGGIDAMLELVHQQLSADDAQQ